MKNFEVIIGIEVHVVLKTNTKMFSYAKNTHYAEPNTAVSWIDLALPGMLPQPNKKAVEKAIILADALYMNINYQNIQFDRKNYFYMDLPKGFQITQQYYPIGTNGKIVLSNNKEIIIERIHIEEDTAKKISRDNTLLMDYNRAGIPLIEIVTTPCINSSDEAYEYLNQLKRILIFKDISDAKLEDGSMRCDVNISIRPLGAKWYGNKVEIKNINSLNNVKKAIDYEIKRQIKAILNNQEVNQETRRFNDENNTTEFMRQKSDSVNYRYITEPNIINIKLETKAVNNILANANDSPFKIQQELKNNYHFNDQQITILLDNFETYQFFNLLRSKIDMQAIDLYNWIINELVGVLDKLNIRISELSTWQIEQLVVLLQSANINQTINNKQAKHLLLALFENKNKTINELIDEFGYKQITDKKIIEEIIKKYMDTNQEMLDQYPNRPERVEKFFVGMVMKETNAQANPIITMEVLKKLLQTK